MWFLVGKKILWGNQPFPVKKKKRTNTKTKAVNSCSSNQKCFVSYTALHCHIRSQLLSALISNIRDWDSKAFSVRLPIIQLTHSDKWPFLYEPFWLNILVCVTQLKMALSIWVLLYSFVLFCCLWTRFFFVFLSFLIQFLWGDCVHLDMHVFCVQFSSVITVKK